MSFARLFLSLLLLPSILLSYDPPALYLTWQKDPLTTMTIMWVSPLDYENDTVQYRPHEDENWTFALGSHTKLPNDTPYYIHQVELTGLKPNTPYSFQIGHEGPTFKFRTAPKDLNDPIHFVAGGDVYHDTLEEVDAMTRQAAKYDPLFALVGGDIAYSVSKLTFFTEKFDRWFDLLKVWKKTLVTKEGYLIPIIPAIGNHEVIGGNNESPKKAKFFYTLFPFPGSQGYNVLDFANYLSVFILDSGHTHPIDGAQSEWLAKQLSIRQSVDNKVALYHIGAYPSYRPEDGPYRKKIVKNWVPLFEKYGLSVAFENHDHAYKRTHLILKGEINPKGVLYIGDGSWGISDPRKPKTPQKRWYLAKSAKETQVSCVTLFDDKRVYRSINIDGQLIDYFEQDVKPKSKENTFKVQTE